MLNTFILSYDPLSDKYSLNQINAFIRANAYTYQYYMPLIGTYLIKSKADLLSLIDTYNGFFDGSNFFVAQIFPTVTGGALPQDMWDWINSDNPPPLPMTAVTRSS